jgi:DNA repair exonuclease SbcCD ATPase subunit
MGFPVNRTIKLNYADVNSFSKDLKNTNVKLSITCSDTDKKLINRKEIKDRFESLGAVSVSVHTESIKEKKETANEITKTSTLEEKFILWCKTQNIKYSESAVNKIRFLDENKLIKDMLPQHIFRLLWVDIRGAKGLYNFKDGSLYVDFRNYTGGLIVVAGDTGKGKTTFIENCHPYPQMFTREGKLQDQFFLKDSHRILCYVDEKGTYYKPEIYIDPKNDCKYFMETSTDGEKWEKLKQCDGSLNAYMDYVNGTFGTKDVFLRTSFVVNSDSSITDIARASKGELAEFFSKLIGTDYIKILYKEACEKRKESDKNLSALSATLKDSDIITGEINKVKTSITDNTESLSCIYKEITKEEVLLESLKKTRDEISKTSSEEYIEKLKTRLENIETELFEQNTSINTDKIYTDNKQDIDELAGYITKKDICTKEISDITEKINSILSKTSELKSKKELLNKCIAEYSESLLKWSFEIEKMSHKIYKDGDKCRECGEIIRESEKPELFIDSKKYEIQINILNKNIELTNELKSNKEKELSDIIEEAEKLNESYHDLKTIIEKDKLSLSECNTFIELHTNLIPLCNYIHIDIESINKKITELTKEKDSINKELESNKDNDILSVNSNITDTAEKLKSLNADKDKLLIASGELNTKQKTLEKENTDNNELKTKVNFEKQENEDWNCICDALSNEGIQSMELKDKVPEITDTANAILEKIYGDKFTGYIKTDKESGKKTINDFIIMVTNNENGWDMPLKMVSTGERVWIEQAFFYAFSITGTEQSGSGYSVRFMDEKDGSLDSDLRGKYVEMINASHIAGNAYQTVLITHSQEIKDSAKQIINF